MSKTIIKLDCPSTNQSGVEFDLEHAKNLLRLEASKGLKNWKISSGQPYTEKDGEIISTTKSGVAKSSAE